MAPIDHHKRAKEEIERYAQVATRTLEMAFQNTEEGAKRAIAEIREELGQEKIRSNRKDAEIEQLKREKARTMQGATKLIVRKNELEAKLDEADEYEKKYSYLLRLFLSINPGAKDYILAKVANDATRRSSTEDHVARKIMVKHVPSGIHRQVVKERDELKAELEKKEARLKQFVGWLESAHKKCDVFELRCKSVEARVDTVQKERDEEVAKLETEVQELHKRISDMDRAQCAEEDDKQAKLQSLLMAAEEERVAARSAAIQAQRRGAVTVPTESKKRECEKGEEPAAKRQKKASKSGQYMGTVYNFGPGAVVTFNKKQYTVEALHLRIPKKKKSAEPNTTLTLVGMKNNVSIKRVRLVQAGEKMVEPAFKLGYETSSGPVHSFSFEEGAAYAVTREYEFVIDESGEIDDE